jgi:hypothetical protein
MHSKSFTDNNVILIADNLNNINTCKNKPKLYELSQDEGDKHPVFYKKNITKNVNPII